MNLDPVIAAILARYDNNGNWHLTTTELLKLLAIDTACFYRTLYTVKNKLHYTEALDGFNQDTTGELIMLLDTVAGKDALSAEQVFSRAGLFIPYAWGIELTEILMALVNTTVKTHSIDYEDAGLMLRYRGALWQAYLLYINTHFVFSEILEKAVSHFCRCRETTGNLNRTALYYLDNLFLRHILDWEKLFYPLYQKLEIFFKAETTNPQSDPEAEEEEHLAKAKALFSLKGEKLELAGIKRRYKALMKIFHPDLNPAGLEEAKKINTAYTILLAALK